VRPMGNTFSKSSCVAHWSHPLYVTSDILIMLILTFSFLKISLPKECPQKYRLA
jgi:hypothetical protein